MENTKTNIDLICVYIYSIPRGKMEQILLAYGLPKETVAAIMILYKNVKVKVHSLDGDIDFFEIFVVHNLLRQHT